MTGENHVVLGLEGVTVRFGGVSALTDVTMRIPQGPGISAIIGPNGAGKTTLLRLLCGRLKPNRGRIDLADRDLATVDSVERARRIAVLVQSDAPHPLLNVADYVWLYLSQADPHR